MDRANVDTFLDLLRRCGLVDHDQLDGLLRKLRDEKGSNSPIDTDDVATRLVQSGLITRWQCEKLFAGRYKGFFLGNYKLLDHLGGGDSTTVYLAEHMLMQRRVAIRVLPKNLAENPAYVARFRRAAQAAAALDHRNFVRTYDVDYDGDIHYLVMEYVAGRDLQSTVRQDGPLAYAKAAEYIRQAAEGLARAHQAGLLHRDVKPANLLVDSKGVVKILGLGTARLTVEDPTEDARGDILGLGCSLYFLLTGHPPFVGGSLLQRLIVQQVPPPSIYKDRPDAPPRLVEVCMTMMAKQPERRYQTATEVLAALAQWQAAGMGESG